MRAQYCVRRWSIDAYVKRIRFLHSPKERETNLFTPWSPPNNNALPKMPYALAAALGICYAPDPHLQVRKTRSKD